MKTLARNQAAANKAALMFESRKQNSPISMHPSSCAAEGCLRWEQLVEKAHQLAGATRPRPSFTG
jgi:hypothetical protein